MELFVAFMQVKGVRGALCKLLLKVDDTSTTKPTQSNLPFNSTIEWACSKNSQHPKTTLMTLDFLSELFQVAYAGESENMTSGIFTLGSN